MSNYINRVSPQLNEAAKESVSNELSRSDSKKWNSFERIQDLIVNNDDVFFDFEIKTLSSQELSFLLRPENVRSLINLSNNAQFINTLQNYADSYSSLKAEKK